MDYPEKPGTRAVLIVDFSRYCWQESMKDAWAYPAICFKNITLAGAISPGPWSWDLWAHKLHRQET